MTIYINFQSPLNKRRHMKLEENWPRVSENKLFKGVNGQQMDRWQIITIHVAHSEPCK